MLGFEAWAGIGWQTHWGVELTVAFEFGRGVSSLAPFRGVLSDGFPDSLVTTDVSSSNKYIKSK